MASLDEFLSEIGVGSLSTIIELPTPDAEATTPAPAAKLHERITEEVTKTDDQTLALLKDQWSDFSEQLRTGDTLMRQLKSEEAELKALEDEMDGPDAVLPPLVSHLETQQSLAAAHLLATTSVALVSALLTFHSTVSALSDATTAGELPKAVQELRSVSRAVEVGAEEWVEQTDLWKALIRWAADEETRLESALQSAAEACFEIELPNKDNGQTAQLVFHDRVSAAPDGPELEVRTLLQGLQDLAVITGRKDPSDAILVRFAKQILRHFVAPFLEANGPRTGDKAFAKTRCEFALDSTQPDRGVHRILLRPSTSSGDGAIEGLSTFLAFLTDKSSLFPRSRHEVPSKQAAIVTAHLTPSLQSHVISSHLMPSLPSSVAALDAYTSVLAKATAFEADFLPNHSLFAFLPASLRRDGHEVEEQRVIRSWATRVPHHWARHVGDSALARVRNSVKSWDWGDGEVVDVEVREEEEMLGLLLGLGLVDPEDEAAVAAAAAGDRSQLDALERSMGPSFDGKRRLPRELALQTVPKSAKREMTMEEALRPRVARPRPLPPPERVMPPAHSDLAGIEVTATPTAIPDGPAKRSKLGATKISASTQSDLLETTAGPFVADPSNRQTAALAESDTALPPAPEGASSAPAPASVEADSAAPTIVPHQSDEEVVVIPAPAAADSYAPFETPALTAAGIETTADAALPEDVVQPHEYRATVHDDLGADEETMRQYAPITEENLGQPALDARASAPESATTETREGDVPAEEVVESSPHQLASPPLLHYIKEESAEPELTAVDETAAALSAERSALSPTTAMRSANQTVPNPAVDAERLEAEGDSAHTSTPEVGAPLQLDSLFPADEASSLFTFGGLEGRTTGLAEPSGEEPKERDRPTSPQQPGTSADSSGITTTTALDAAYFPIDDDPYADDSFAEDPYAYESYPAPTHDDFFSPSVGPPPPAGVSPPVEAFPPSVQAPSTFVDPYAPTAVPHAAEETACGVQKQQYTYPLQGDMPAASTRSAMASHFSPGTGVAPGPPPPPPRASSSANTVVARTKPPERRVMGHNALAPDQSDHPLDPATVAPTVGHAVANPYASAHQIDTYPSASLPARSLPQRSSTESPKPTLAPLRSGFTTSSRSNRSGTPDRHSGPITNHIQQRFVSPPPTMLNPYVSMALPPSVPPSTSSYLPANDPLLTGLLTGGGSRTGSAYPSAGKSTVASIGNSSVEQVRANSAQSFVPTFGPESQHHTPLYGQHAPYGTHFHGQPAMRMRGGCSFEQPTTEPVLRLRGGADLGDMDDDGNHSADDWGFGDNELAADADDTEGAWGFEAEPDETETPAPPIPKVTPSAHREALSLDRRASSEPQTSLAHTANASISSTISQPRSTSTSRPASLVFSPSLAHPARSSLELVDLDDRSVEGGDDAWGFDEEDAIDQDDLALETSPDQVAVSGVDSTAVPSVPAAEKLDATARAVSHDTAGLAAQRIVSSEGSANAALPQSHDEFASAKHDADAEDEDEWGFGEDRGDLEPSRSDARNASASPAPSTAVGSASGAAAAGVPASESSVASEQLDGERASQALGAPKSPFGSLHDEGGDDDAWDLEPPPAHSLVASPSAEDKFDYAQEDEEAGLQPRKAESLDRLALSGARAEDAEVEPDSSQSGHTSASAEDHAASTAYESEHAEHFATRLAVVKDGAPLPSEPVTALTAPATELRDVFPDDSHQSAPNEPAASPSFSPTPSLPQPLPHSDDFAPGAIYSPSDAPLLDYAAAKLEDAQLIDDESQAAQSTTLIADGADGHAELTAVEDFAGDRRAAQEWEQDMADAATLAERDDEEDASTQLGTTEDVPVESSMADFDDFADFAEHQAEQHPRTVAWEPFEEPSGEPESTPASAEGYDRRNAFERDGFSAEPSEAPEILSSTETACEHSGDRPNDVGSAESAIPTVTSSLSEPQDDEDQLVSTVSDDAHRLAVHSDGDGPDTEASGSESDAAATTAAGAEILEDDQNTAPASPFGEDPVVQHAALRPWPRDESSVQHESIRPIVTEAVAPGILLPSQEAHPQQRTFSPPPTALPMQEDEAAEWELNDNAAGAEVLADVDFVHEAGPPQVPEESAVQHVADRPLLAGSHPHAQGEGEVVATTAQLQEHAFSPAASTLPLTEQLVVSDGATDSQHGSKEDHAAPEVSASSEAANFDVVHAGGNKEVNDATPPFAGKRSTDFAADASAEEPAHAEADLVHAEHDHDLAAQASQTAAEEERQTDEDPERRTAIAADVPPSPASDGMADVDDPWDLDPLQPDDAVADFAETLMASQPGNAPGKPADVNCNYRTIGDTAATESNGFGLRDTSQVVETPVDPSVRKDDQIVADTGHLEPSEDAVRPSGSQNSWPRAPAPEPLSPRPAAEAAEATLDSWRWDDDEAAPVSEPLESEETSNKEAEVPVPNGSSEPQENRTSAARHEKMMVSRQSREIVAMAEEILSTAFEIASPSFVLPQFGLASAPLLRHFVSILSLYRATASVHNSDLLASVPAIAMQFANDAEWIGREANRLWEAAIAQHVDQISQDLKRDVQVAIQSMRQLGRDTRQRQISIQQAALMECLDEAGGFLRTSDENRFAACERALQQVTHILQRLALVWKPIMTPTALYTALGGLVNEVLLRVLDEIEEQTDISEEESIRLNRLSKMLHELESLFDGSETNVGREVPIWYKFSFLSELLEASMADFTFLFDNRFLLDFTPQELVRLLRALFADSPQRDAAVKRILQGHPDALADAEEES